MLIASFLFALTMLFAKLLSGSMGSVEVTFWRNAIGLAVIGVFVLRKPIHNIGGKPITLIFRGVIGTIALLTFFIPSVRLLSPMPSSMLKRSLFLPRCSLF
jgi:drug/metabolite transporter (DMT)-like permease